MQRQKKLNIPEQHIAIEPFVLASAQGWKEMMESDGHSIRQHVGDNKYLYLQEPKQINKTYLTNT